LKLGLVPQNHPSGNQEYQCHHKVPDLDAVAIWRNQNPNSEEKADSH
jgi:hypothetical protein